MQLFTIMILSFSLYSIFLLTYVLKICDSDVC